MQGTKKTKVIVMLMKTLKVSEDEFCDVKMYYQDYLDRTYMPSEQALDQRLDCSMNPIH